MMKKVTQSDKISDKKSENRVNISRAALCISICTVSSVFISAVIQTLLDMFREKSALVDVIEIQNQLYFRNIVIITALLFCILISFGIFSAVFSKAEKRFRASSIPMFLFIPVYCFIADKTESVVVSIVNFIPKTDSYDVAAAQIILYIIMSIIFIAVSYYMSKKYLKTVVI